MKKFLSLLIKSILTLNICMFPMLYWYFVEYNRIFYLEQIFPIGFILLFLFILCWDWVVLILMLPILFIEIICRESLRTFRNSLIIAELMHNLRIWKKHWKASNIGKLVT